MSMYDILFLSPNMISVGIKELLMNADRNYKDVFNMGILDTAKIYQTIDIDTLISIHGNAA